MTNTVKLKEAGLSKQKINYCRGIAKAVISEELIFGEEKNKRKIFFKNLYKIGYRYFDKRRGSKKDTYLVRAFKRRFHQKKVNGKIDKKTLQISHYLAKIS